MAGGQHRRGGQRSLGQLARDRPATVARPRHCWVTGPEEAPGPWPGVLIVWQRRGPLWFGRVTYVVLDEGETVVVDAWVPATALRSAG